MDLKRTGNLMVKFSEGKIIQQEFIKKYLELYIKVSLGSQNFITSSIPCSECKLIWSDLMKFVKTHEETIKIECFTKNKNSLESKIGSVILPIQTVVSNGFFKDNIMLMNLGRVSMHLKIELQFEEKSELPFEYPTVIYPISPPEQPHVHAYSIPPNFVYTHPAYYPSQHVGDLLYN
ncbi:hypothetical protein SteCoe_16655 [Stentor coeruleus]|uniref:C2 domain-containing protein n=1 Tax=Stentor coeruleus TaxID=5963 RepID=A0A1R2C0R5_9CILI|nr:hypothetical protein SteCoe_16655 [Stentor coeruleus]